MATPSNAKVISLKLLIDTKAKRVLFAEAGKDFVDFLFHLLHLPVGTVNRLLIEQTMGGTLGNLYESIQNLSENYFQSNQTKVSALKPKALLAATQVPFLSLDGPRSATKTYYTCPTNNNSGKYLEFHKYFSDNANAVCPTCTRNLSNVIQYVAAVNEGAVVGEGGFVKGVVSYMVMDDLGVTPTSAISCIAMLNQLNIKDLGAIEERVVDLGMLEGLKLLKISFQSNFQSKKVLTSVFLENTED